MRTDKTSLGAIIKAARLKKGLTQENLAEKVSTGQRHMMSIENEGGHPSYKLLYQIIRELDIPADSIFYPEKDSGDSRFNSLLHLLRRCSDGELRVITALAEALLAESAE